MDWWELTVAVFVADRHGVVLRLFFLSAGFRSAAAAVCCCRCGEEFPKPGDATVAAAAAPAAAPGSMAIDSDNLDAEASYIGAGSQFVLSDMLLLLLLLLLVFFFLSCRT